MWTLEVQPKFGRRPAAIAGRIDARRFRSLPQKRHPVARRFKCARLIRDCADSIVREGNSWLASKNAKTGWRKFQRSVAAEFICPIEHLANYLDGDFSDSNVEDAASAVDVSYLAMSLQLKNNFSLPWQNTDHS
ncbi:MAG: hypothetical protein OXJ64_05630, partial [Boseongicola sp.]|nr:hypothetical protein [Boseongicola sp.]